MYLVKGRFFFFGQRQKAFSLSAMLHDNRYGLQKIYNHPFNEQLFEGTLSSSVFGHYLRDDYFYLRHFSLTLQQLATQTSNINSGLTAHLNYLAKDLIDNELNMQQQYKEHLHDFSSHTPGRVISSYADFLSRTARREELSVGLSAVLPCFWVYYQLGEIKKQQTCFNTNPYSQWIKTYSSPEFIKATLQLSRTVNQLLGEATPKLQVKMNEAFASSVQFELDFFDEVYYPDNRIGLIA